MYMPDCASALALLCPPPWTTHHRAPSSASRPTSGCHTAQGVSRGARVAVRCQGSHHTAVQRPTTRPSCWSLLLLPAATDAHCSPATPSQLTQGRHRAVRSARDVPGSVDPAGMAKWGREGARSLNCRFSLCFCVPNQISTPSALCADCALPHGMPPQRSRFGQAHQTMSTLHNSPRCGERLIRALCAKSAALCHHLCHFVVEIDLGDAAGYHHLTNLGHCLHILRNERAQHSGRQKYEK